MLIMLPTKTIVTDGTFASASGKFLTDVLN